MLESERAIARLVRLWEGDAATLRDAVRDFLWGGEDASFDPCIRDDPHALGWLQQYLAERTRREEFEAHTSREAKHSTASSTTQLYTPRWVADWLAARCFEAFGGVPARVLDPACGGGQLLHAAGDALVALGLSRAEAVARLHGVELDEDAAWACRESLKLWAGARDGELAAQIDAQIVVGDGLLLGEPADVVLANPPYMGRRSMPAALKRALDQRKPFHLDLYVAFLDRCVELGEVVGVLAQQTVWYLRRFEAARANLLVRGQLLDFAHLGHGVFDALQGEKANVVAFTFARGQPGGATNFWDARDQADKAAALRAEPLREEVASFAAIPSQPLAFWLPRPLRDAFGGRTVGDIAEIPGSQNKTGDNARFVKRVEDAPDDWVPYSKGGRYAPWWGNWGWAVDWSDDARAFYASNPTSNLLATQYWYREGLCYSDFGGQHFNARWMPPGCVFDMAGPAIFVDGDDRDVLAALLVVLNSSAARSVLNALNPTLHYQVRDVRNLPLPPSWDDAIAQLAPMGHALVTATRRALAGDLTAAHITTLETTADEAVAALYGVPEIVARTRRRHHELPT